MKVYIVDMPDGSKWGVPVDVIARSRALHYIDEYGGDIERSLNEDTIPLFNKYPAEIFDWAANNMEWSDVAHSALLIQRAPVPDFQEGWVNGNKTVTFIDAGAKHRSFVEYYLGTGNQE